MKLTIVLSTYYEAQTLYLNLDNFIDDNLSNFLQNKLIY